MFEKETIDINKVVSGKLASVKITIQKGDEIKIKERLFKQIPENYYTIKYFDWINDTYSVVFENDESKIFAVPFVQFKSYFSYGTIRFREKKDDYYFHRRIVNPWSDEQKEELHQLISNQKDLNSFYHSQLPQYTRKLYASRFGHADFLFPFKVNTSNSTSPRFWASLLLFLNMYDIPVFGRNADVDKEKEIEDVKDVIGRKTTGSSMFYVMAIWGVDPDGFLANLKSFLYNYQVNQ